MQNQLGRFVAAVTVLAGLAACGTRAAGAAGEAKPAKGQESKAGKPSTPSKPPEAAGEKKAKFPGPAVDKLLKGWEGVAWGATLEEFKKKYPEAKEAAGGRWVTGRGQSDLAGQPVTAEYGFGKKDQLAVIRFEPAAAARKTFRQALVEAGVAREGPKPGWTNNGVSLVLAEVNGEQFAVVLNARFTDPMEKKAPAPK